MGKPDIDAEIKVMIAEIDAKLRREDQEIDAVRALPVQPGRCPGSGLRTTSAGGYTYTVCRVCYAVLDPWDWNNTFPLAIEHDREISTD